jgi:hypothetical protein
MVRFVRIVLAVLVSAICLCSCGREGRVIPKSKLSKIYAEMFLADAWLVSAPMDAKGKADTMAFYEPIFEKYGYTVEDYWASVSYYLQDPDRFSRVLRKSSVMLENEFNVLEKQRDEATEAARMKDMAKPRMFHSVYGVDGQPLDGDVLDLDAPKRPRRLEDRPI